MPFDLSKFFVVGISSRALFDLETEDSIYRGQGLKAYCEYQLRMEDEVLTPGAAFPLVRAIMKLNEAAPDKRKTEVIVLSRNNADTGLRIFKSIQHHELGIVRAAFTSGAPLANYLEALDVDLFLSASEDDVQSAVNAGFAAGLIYAKPEQPARIVEELRIAFDGDAVLFSEESERIYKQLGLEEFLAHERTNARKPLPDGPFAKLLRTLARLQLQGEREGKALIRTALVTARNSPAHERVIRTFRNWGVRVDEAFFLGGAPKQKILQAFSPHIFFDDQDLHCAPASHVCPTARVPWATAAKVPLNSAQGEGASRTDK